MLHIEAIEEWHLLQFSRPIGMANTSLTPKYLAGAAKRVHPQHQHGHKG